MSTLQEAVLEPSGSGGAWRQGAEATRRESLVRALQPVPACLHAAVPGRSTVSPLAVGHDPTQPQKRPDGGAGDRLLAIAAHPDELRPTDRLPADLQSAPAIERSVVLLREAGPHAMCDPRGSSERPRPAPGRPESIDWHDQTRQPDATQDASIRRGTSHPPPR